MSGRQLVGLLTFVVVSGIWGLYSMPLHFKMVDQVDAKLPTEQQFWRANTAQAEGMGRGSRVGLLKH